MLEEIENQLKELLAVDKKNWVSMYLLLKNVESNEIWKENYHSYSQWIKTFCFHNKTHESIIWNRLKAGKVYESYVEVKESQGIEVPSIENANVSADSLIILEKINKYDSEMASKLVDKVMQNELKRAELKEVYKQIRPPIEKISNNPHYKRNLEITPNIDIKQTKITANDIVLALYNETWLGTEIKRKYFQNKDFLQKYKALTEFGVYTGTTRHSRRLDLLAIENITTSDPWKINLHGIEIKVSKNDLENDKKYTEYAEFVDYLWLAVPLELIEVAQNTKPNECGIILIERSENGELQAQMIESANKINSNRRMETLEKIILKLITKY